MPSIQDPERIQELWMLCPAEHSCPRTNTGLITRANRVVQRSRHAHGTQPPTLSLQVDRERSREIERGGNDATVRATRRVFRWIGLGTRGMVGVRSVETQAQGP